MTSNRSPATEHRTRLRSFADGLARCIMWLSTPLLLLIISRFIARQHVIELMSHFQVQYFIAGVLALLVILALRRWRCALVPLVCVAITGWSLWPFWFGGSAALHGTDTIRLFHANVLTSNSSHERTIEEINRHDPDIIVLQEVNAAWITATQHLRSTHPYTIEAVRSDNFGILIMSKLPLREDSIIEVGEAGVPSASAVLDLNGHAVRLFATHPLPPLQQRGFELRNDQLARTIELLTEEHRPMIIIGDLNITPWSGHYRDLIAALGLINAREGHGIAPTWPADFPALCRIPIDHCLVSDELAVYDFFVGDAIGSDHLPIIVDLSMKDRATGESIE